MPDVADTRAGAFAALRYRNYRLMWISAVVSSTGRWFQVLAIPLIVYDLSGQSAGWVGLSGFAQMLPVALLCPFAGAVADRYPRRTILILTQSAQSVVALVFVLMWFGDVRSPGAYVAVSILAGTTSGLNLPAWQAFVSELVPRDTLMSAVTLNSAQFNMSRMLGPSLAGLVIAQWGPGWAFLLNAASFLAVIAALVSLRLPRIQVEVDGRLRPLSEFAQTLVYTRAKAGISTAVFVGAVIGFFGITAQQMSIVVAEDVFGQGERGFGWMLSSAGVGAVVASPIVAEAARRFERSRIQQAALLLYSGGVCAMALAPWFAMALAGMLAMGMAHIASASTLNTTIQLQVDEQLRARVLAVYLTGLLLSSPLGQLIMGQTIEMLGPRETFLAFGLAFFALAVLLASTQRLRALDSGSGTHQPSAAAHPSTPAPPRQPSAQPAMTRDTGPSSDSA
ncbi:MAG: MFS transporter [Acidimicrobiaceae bacterium]|nr:MFS transporter [Acidimicrobiaceae bacterium]